MKYVAVIIQNLLGVGLMVASIGANHFYSVHWFPCTCCFVLGAALLSTVASEKGTP